MLASEQVEELICLLATWDHPLLTSQFMAFRGSFPIDFTPEFLGRLSEDHLRHVFLALCLQNQRLPQALPAAISLA